jgi:hypothetical protein
VEKHPSVYAEIADGHFLEEFLLKLTDTDGDPFTIRLQNFLFSGGTASHKKKAVSNME